MLPDRVSNTGPLTYESGALPIALRGPAIINEKFVFNKDEAQHAHTRKYMIHYLIIRISLGIISFRVRSKIGIF